MAYHKSWTNEDLRVWMIQNDFFGSKDCGHFSSVVYNGTFCTFSFIEKAGKYYVISSVREFEAATRFCSAGYVERAKMVKEVTKDEGNLLYRAIKATKKTSKKGYYYYDLGKALDMIPSDNTLKLKFNA